MINLSSSWITWELWHGKTQQTVGCTIHRQVAWAREESWAWPWFWAMVSSSRASPWSLLQLLLWVPSVMCYVLWDEINPSFSSHRFLMVRHFLPAANKATQSVLSHATMYDSLTYRSFVYLCMVAETCINSARNMYVKICINILTFMCTNVNVYKSVINDDYNYKNI